VHDIVQLLRPLISLDLETTGIHWMTDRIIQIGVCKLYPNGDYKEWKTYINPGIPIPKEAMESHHITDEQVKDAPTFLEMHLKLAKAMENCDLCGYNLATFDVKLLGREFERSKFQWEPPQIVDGFRLWMRFYPRNLTAFIEEFALRDSEGKQIPQLVEEFKTFTAHDALHDARWTMKALKGFFERTKTAPRSVKEIHDMFFVLPRDAGSLDPDAKLVWKDGEACLGGWSKKHPGKSLKALSALDRRYLEWIAGPEFDTNRVVKKIVQEALQGRFPTSS
jgi:DNA polymerase III epsilon subunit-like protein